MQLYFIRHGQSTNNLLWDQTSTSNGRSMDPELTEKGWRQARRLAEYLRDKKGEHPTDVRDSHNAYGFGLTHLYTSLMVRAVATGSQVARALNIPLVGWLDLHEEGGIYLNDPQSGEPVGYPGKTQAYFASHYPELVLQDGVAREGWWNRPLETSAESAARARRFFEELLRAHGNTTDRVAVFSHGGFYNAFMRQVLGLLGDTRKVWFQINNTAITRLDFNEGEIIAVYLNRVDFLPADLIT